MDIEIYTTEWTDIHSQLLPDHLMCGLACQKQVSRAATNDYIPQFLWDVITCPCFKVHLRWRGQACACTECSYMRKWVSILARADTQGLMQRKKNKVSCGNFPHPQAFLWFVHVCKSNQNEHIIPFHATPCFLDPIWMAYMRGMRTDCGYFYSFQRINRLKGNMEYSVVDVRLQGWFIACSKLIILR